MIWRRDRRAAQSKTPEDPEQLFTKVREVEAQLRKSLTIFRDHLDELEAEIAESRQYQEEV